MPDSHRIRLHGPWQVEVFQTSVNSVGRTPAEFSFRAKVPFVAGELNRQWKAASDPLETDIFDGERAVRLLRRFQWPHAEQAGRTLEIQWQLSGAGQEFSAFLNDEMLVSKPLNVAGAPSDDATVISGNVNHLIQSSNQLCFECAFEALSTLAIASACLIVTELANGSSSSD